MVPKFGGRLIVIVEQGRTAERTFIATKGTLEIMTTTQVFSYCKRNICREIAKEQLQTNYNFIYLCGRDLRPPTHEVVPARRVFRYAGIDVSHTILYNPGSLYFLQPLLLDLVMCVALECHACGAVACFSNIPYCKVSSSTLVPAGAPPSQHHHHDRIIWTEPVRYWRKACRLACLNHTVLLQIIMAISPTLHSIIVIADDPRGKRRPKANSTSNRTKKR
jgi:hypothetical protein